jgi:hypothetical protein
MLGYLKYELVKLTRVSLHFLTQCFSYLTSIFFSRFFFKSIFFCHFFASLSVLLFQERVGQTNLGQLVFFSHCFLFH